MKRILQQLVGRAGYRISRVGALPLDFTPPEREVRAALRSTAARARGVLIIDDYGCWQGARKAVDEFIASQKITAMLHRIDETGRLLIKP